MDPVWIRARWREGRRRVDLPRQAQAFVDLLSFLASPGMPDKGSPSPAGLRPSRHRAAHTPPEKASKKGSPKSRPKAPKNQLKAAPIDPKDLQMGILRLRGGIFQGIPPLLRGGNCHGLRRPLTPLPEHPEVISSTCVSYCKFTHKVHFGDSACSDLFASFQLWVPLGLPLVPIWASKGVHGSTFSSWLAPV